MLSVSNIAASDVYASLAAFIAFYSALLVVEMFLMLKYIRLGPASLHTGKYDFEAAHKPAA
jgi:cytochrome d ubiquinol oxidase subunit I